jgi:hypothetical protein
VQPRNDAVVHEAAEYRLVQRAASPHGVLWPCAQPAKCVSWLELFHQEVFAADEATVQAERGQGRAARAVLAHEAVKELDPCI